MRHSIRCVKVETIDSNHGGKPETYYFENMDLVKESIKITWSQVMDEIGVIPNLQDGSLEVRHVNGALLLKAEPYVIDIDVLRERTHF